MRAPKRRRYRPGTEFGGTRSSGLLAAGNLVGSNLFNVAVLGLDDMLYLRGPLLPDVSPGHLITLTGAITMTGIAIIGLTFRAQRKRFRLSWDALAIVAVYATCLALLGRAV